MIARLLAAASFTLLFTTPALAQSPDWAGLEKEAVATLLKYVRIDTSVPPGDVRKAADLLESILKS